MFPHPRVVHRLFKNIYKSIYIDLSNDLSKALLILLLPSAEMKHTQPLPGGKACRNTNKS